MIKKWPIKSKFSQFVSMRINSKKIDSFEINNDKLTPLSYVDAPCLRLLAQLFGFLKFFNEKKMTNYSVLYH